MLATGSLRIIKSFSMYYARDILVQSKTLSTSGNCSQFIVSCQTYVVL